MDSIFEFFFKYRPLLFQEGDFRFLSPWPLPLTLLVVAGAIALGVLTYTRAPGRATRVERGVMIGLRLVALGILMFCLFKPALVLTSVVPQRNFVGILVDDSRSMSLADEGGEARSQWIKETFGGEGTDLLRELEATYSLRFFGFSGETARVNSVDDLTFNGTRTDLPAALTRAREELAGVPVAGFVVLTDGADNGGTPIARALVPIQAASLPVYTVGIGEEDITPDVQVDRVDLPRTVLMGSSLVVDAVVTGKDLRTREVTLVVEDDQRILAQEQVTLSENDDPTVVPLRFTMNDAGARRVRFSIAPQEGERVVQNNERTLMVDVKDQTEKLLFFEGEPRSQVAFMRRAVRGDDHIQMVLLQRTAADKYLRLDVDGPDELAAGFPKTREELFRYRALILGSVEASYFTHDQLAMIADFVSVRGGGLLLLGGRNAFAEGGFAGTPIEEILPVMLELPAPDPRDAFLELKIRPTPEGLNHPATQIIAGAAATMDKWDSLPALSTLNRIERAKPGATVLLEGTAADGSKRIVLSHHRYGRGKVLVLPVQDTWIWQMHVEIPLEDMTHETLWRQLIRWLVDGVPEHVGAMAEREQVEINELVRIRAEVSDSAYREVNNAEVTATVTAADGTVQTVALAWTLDQDGEYAGTFRPTTAGDYEVAVDARRDTLALGSDAFHVFVGPSDTEFFDAGMRRTLLERIAEETGGRYYTPETVSSLPEDLKYTGAGVTLTEERDLWDMPFLFLMMIGLVGAEWAFRRRRGLV